MENEYKELLPRYDDIDLDNTLPVDTSIDICSQEDRRKRRCDFLVHWRFAEVNKVTHDHVVVAEVDWKTGELIQVGTKYTLQQIERYLSRTYFDVRIVNIKQIQN